MGIFCCLIVKFWTLWKQLSQSYCSKTTQSHSRLWMQSTKRPKWQRGPVWWDNLAFPSCSAPTGVPTHRKEAPRAGEASRRDVMQKKGHLFWGWPGNDLTSIYYHVFVPPNNPALIPTHITATRFFSTPPHSLIKGVTNYVLWSLQSSFFFAPRRLYSSVTRGNRGEKVKGFSDVSVD